MRQRARRNPTEENATIDILVVRFLDTRTDARWWQRLYETIGYVTTPVDDEGCFLDEKGLLAYVAREFGRDAYAIYFNPCAAKAVQKNPPSYLDRGVPQDFHGKPLEHLSMGFYRVTDAMAGRLAKLVGAKLPGYGKELRVAVPGRVEPMWLQRTIERGRTKRPWVWAVY